MRHFSSYWTPIETSAVTATWAFYCQSTFSRAPQKKNRKTYYQRKREKEDKKKHDDEVSLTLLPRWSLRRQSTECSHTHGPWGWTIYRLGNKKRVFFLFFSLLCVFISTAWRRRGEEMLRRQVRLPQVYNADGVTLLRVDHTTSRLAIRDVRERKKKSTKDGVFYTQ